MNGDPYTDMPLAWQRRMQPDCPPAPAPAPRRDLDRFEGIVAGVLIGLSVLSLAATGTLATLWLVLS